MKDLEAQTLELHEKLVALPSLSHEESDIADFLQAFLEQRGVTVRRIENNLVARAGSGPRLLLNTHFDTVPPTSDWTRDPFLCTREGERIYGLGSNDAKAAVAGMTMAFLEAHDNGGPCEITLLLAPEEETGGRGTELAWPLLVSEGLEIDAVVVGEPTGLDVAIAQKGLLILELRARGDACHSAHAHALGAKNPIRTLARDLEALRDLDLRPAHPLLGLTSCEPTVIEGGEVRNRVPGQATCCLDLRTVPGLTHDMLIERVEAMVQSDVHVHSSRLEPFQCPEDASLLQAASSVRPQAPHYGSRTLSDLVWFSGLPAIKCGPGRTERSHTADEYVLESEVREGVRFYVQLTKEFAKQHSEPKSTQQDDEATGKSVAG